MSLSVGELKKVSVQSIRDIAVGLRAKAASMRATKAGVTDLPHKGTWTGVAADNADHEIGTFAQGVGRDAEAYEDAARKVDRAGDEFEGVKQLLTKLENEAAGKFAINEATGEVTPLTKDFNKADRDYIANTIKQLCAAGGQANDDLAAGIHATDASGATSPAGAAGGPLPEMPGSAIKPDGVVGGMQNLAAPNPDGDPGATKAAAATASGDTINYKELYPKTPGTGDKLTIDPSKAGSLTGTVGALDKMPGAPKPQDGFGSGVAKQFLKGANGRVDGTIDEVKSKAGLNGADKFAESWTNSAKGLEHQIERTLFPGAAMAEDAKNVIDQAVTSYQHPEKIPENIGKTTVDAAIAGTTVPLGGEGALARTGLEDASIAGRGGLLDTPHVPHDVAPTPGHAPVEPPNNHPGPIADHSSPPVVDHSAPTVGDHSLPQFDPNGGQHYASGDPHYPGGWPPHTPEATWTKGDTEPGWEHINRGPEKPWMDYQAQISGIERTPEGHIPEYVRVNPETGDPVKFDGHTFRGDQEVYLDAKRGYSALETDVGKPWANGMADDLMSEIPRQLRSMPEGAILEIHVSDPVGARAIRQLLDEADYYDVNVIYTPEAP
ncbi:Tox-REase-5 domain-containing protein [Mycobacteroides abscessus]|uniref:Tox-REase-5 domain-containing protein n=1 Tax=Mycobacteroides abscessus TaxID=36809 RepID=UPI002104C577|nr:Tox-REase-5 domain-containing protein [Mycobacteroides abscessus]